MQSKDKELDELKAAMGKHVEAMLPPDFNPGTSEAQIKQNEAVIEGLKQQLATKMGEIAQKE